MRPILGIVILVIALALGVWAGVWWAFIGGIVQVIEAIRAPELSSMQVALGVARIFFAGLIGWVVFLTGLIVSKIVAEGL